MSLGDKHRERNHLETTTVSSLSDLQKPDDLILTRYQFNVVHLKEIKTIAKLSQ